MARRTKMCEKALSLSASLRLRLATSKIDVYADNSVPDGVVIAEVSFEGSVILRPNEN